MKKFSLVCAVLTVATASFAGGTSQACDRVVYRTNRVVYAAHNSLQGVVVHQPSQQTVNHVSVSASAVSSPRTEVVSVTQVTQKVTSPTIVEKLETVHVVEKIPEIAQGSTVKAKVRFAGHQAGEITILSGGLEVQCSILEWSPNQILFRIPNLDIVNDTDVTVRIFSAEGTLVKSLKGVLTNGTEFTIEAAAGSAPQN